MKKYKVNLDFCLKDLKGDDIPNQKMNELVANMLATSGEKDAVKAWSLALDIFKTPEMEIDFSQKKMIEKVLEESQLNVLARAQVKEYFETLN